MAACLAAQQARSGRGPLLGRVRVRYDLASRATPLKADPLGLSVMPKRQMRTEIDWEQLATSLGLLNDKGESGSSDAARRALGMIVGEAALRSAVDHYIAFHRGFELARQVLCQIHPWSAMSYCYEIFKSSRPIEDRRSAVELLRVVADRRALPWVAEFLANEDAEIQAWGVGVLDQLLWSELIDPAEAKKLLRAAERHGNEAVRDKAAFIRGFRRDRAQTQKRLLRRKRRGPT